MFTPAIGMMLGMTGAAYSGFQSTLWVFMYLFFSILLGVATIILVTYDSVSGQFNSKRVPSPGEFLIPEIQEEHF